MRSHMRPIEFELVRTIPAPTDKGLRDAQTGTDPRHDLRRRDDIGPTPNETDLELGLSYDEAGDVEAINRTTLSCDRKRNLRHITA